MGLGFRLPSDFSPREPKGAQELSGVYGGGVSRTMLRNSKKGNYLLWGCIYYVYIRSTVGIQWLLTVSQLS